MKSIIVVALVGLILSQSFSRLGIIIVFKINQNHIAKTRCINRNKPSVHCNGKCFLIQKLKAETEKERQSLPEKIVKQKDIVYLLSTPRVLSVYFLIELKKKLYVQQFNYSIIGIKSIFQPPE